MNFYRGVFLCFLLPLRLLSQPSGTSIELNQGATNRFELEKKGQTRDENQEEEKERKVFVKLFYSPQLTYRTYETQMQLLHIIDEAPEWSVTYSYKSKYETCKYGDEFGLLFDIKLGKHLHLNLGAGYNKMGYQSGTKLDSVFSYTYSDYVSGWTTDTLLTNVKISLDYSFVSIPILLNYEWKHRNLSYYFGSGLSVEFLEKSNVSIELESITHKNYSHKNFQGAYFAMLNLGMTVPVGKISLFIEPFYKCEINKMEFTSIGYKARLWSTGLKIGIKF